MPAQHHGLRSVPHLDLPDMSKQFEGPGDSRAAPRRHDEAQANEPSITAAGSVSAYSRLVNDGPVGHYGIGQMSLTEANLVQTNTSRADRDPPDRREQTVAVSSPIGRSSMMPADGLRQTSTDRTHLGHNMQSWLTSPHERRAWILGGKPEDFQHRSKDA
nr:hypothetical protein CFP56_20269 [Quercus suber]